ncbi:MAG: hypothetical protein M0R48_09920 [Candidatus Omnitrophica bacterium]|nr:hypothetical protein [Candidatus Omnitrophota bacterium]
MKTKTEAIWPILGCLAKAQEFLKTQEEYTCEGNLQEEFLKVFWRWKDDLEKVPVESRADFSVDPINAWLKERGFDIRLDPVCSPEFAVASILDALLEWKEEGSSCKVKDFTGKLYDGVRMDSEYQILYSPEVGKYLQVYTKTGEEVNMAVCDPAGRLDNFGLTRLAMEINDTTIPDSFFPSRISFPMIDCDEKPDISFLKGLSIKGFRIGEALQQTRFRMNEKGARAESAVAMGFRCLYMIQPTSFDIDSPFLLWINSPKTRYPIFAGYFTTETWKRPKDLK